MENKAEQKPSIAIIATGGTIVGTGEAGAANDYVAGKLPVDDILATIPQVNTLADLKLYPLANIDSNNIAFSHYDAIRSLVRELEADPTVDGIVITHGTDTLEESAFVLNLVLDVHKPVVLTGAMRPASAVSADGPLNLYQAIALAGRPKAGSLGVLALFSNTIYSGRDLSKTNSIKTDAFKPSEFGTLGFMRDDSVYMLQAPYRRHTYESEFTDTDLCHPAKVEIFASHQESDPELLKWMLDHYDGVVIAGTGSGNYSSAIQDVIESYEGDCVIVRSSRLQDGAVYDSPVFDPLKKTIPAFRLSPHKSRLLLMLALMKGMNKEQICQVFEQY